MDLRSLVLQATVALWDRVELGAAAFLPGGLFTFDGKLSLLSGARGGVTAVGQLYSLGTSVEEHRWIGLLGPAGALCLDADCGTVVSAYWSPVLEKGRGTGWRTGALSALARVTPGATVALEMDLGFDRLDQAIRSPLWWYGLRLGRDRLLLDVGMYIGTDYLFGAPFVALNYRARAGQSSRPAPVDDSSYYLDALRRGFTYEIGLGLGHARAIQAYDGGRGVDTLGWAPLALGAGLFVTRRSTVGLRLTSLSFRHDPGDGRRSYLSVVGALAVEHWVHDRLAVAGGLGLGLLGTPPYEANLSRGLAGSFRVSYGVVRLGEGVLKASWELQASVFLNYEVALGSMLLLQWQRF